MKALEALLRLRQAACHPALVPGQEAHQSSKVQRLLEALENAVADGHKALVFSQWTSLLDLIEPPLKEADIHREIQQRQDMLDIANILAANRRSFPDCSIR